MIIYQKCIHTNLIPVCIILLRNFTIYIRQISLYLQSQPCDLFLKYFSLTFSHDMFRPGHHQEIHLKHKVATEGIDLFVVYIMYTYADECMKCSCEATANV
jgi:hypothetical protein